MATTFKFGNGNWAVKEDYALAYNDENGNFKPLPFDFTRASSATRVNKNGLIETVPSGKPRIDFLNNTSGHLLLEPSRENKFPYSNQKVSGGLETFSSGTSSITVTNDYATSPDGTQNAMRMVATCGSTSSDRAGLRDLLSMSATDATLSFYGKSNTGSNQTIAFHFIGGTKTVVTLTNEWQRFTYTETSNIGNYAGVEIRGTYTDTDVDVLLFGFQMEQASYATSYIPTEGSSVTRSAETNTTQGSIPSTVIGQTEGVVYVEFKIDETPSSTKRIIILSDGTGNERIGISMGSNILYAFIVDGGVTQVEIIKSSFTFGNYKCAFAYKNNDFAFYLNGIQVGVDTSGTVASCDRIDLGNQFGVSQMDGIIKDVKLYNTRLSNSELQALTSN